MRQRLGQRHHAERQAGERQDLEGAVFEVGLEHAIERQQRGEQRGDPQDAGGDGAQGLGLGRDAEGKERHRRRIEGDDEPRRTALRIGETDIAQNEGEKGFQHGPTDSASPRAALNCARSSR